MLHGRSRFVDYLYYKLDRSECLKYVRSLGTTGNGYECTSKRSELWQGQYFKWIEGFTA
jgi:hypothetical protein